MPKLEIPLQPKQSQFDRTLDSTPIVLYGGAKGGGKSHGLRSILLKRRFQYPGSRGVIFRRSYRELEDNHIGPLLTQFPMLRPYYKSDKHMFRFPQGSELHFQYCKREADALNYQGVEYHDLGIEEAGQWSEWMFWRLMGSNRTSNQRFPARAALTGNPGGLGHAWLKRLFITKRLKKHELDAGYKPEHFAFVKALVDDNLALYENDPMYVTRLEAEPNEQLRKAYRYGSWDISAGQFYSEIEREIHVVKPFPIPIHWQWFGAYDYGFNHPAVWGWFAGDQDGNVYLVRTLAKAGMHLDFQAAEVHRIEQELIRSKQKRTIQTTFWAGHDCWATKKGGDPTIAEDFLSPRVVGNNIVNLKHANISRKLGAAQLRNYLRYETRKKPDGSTFRWGPRFFIFDLPENEVVIDCLTRMVHDPDDIEDVLKVDATEGDVFTGDDPYDMTRYGLMSRPLVATPTRKSSGTSYNENTQVKNRPSWMTV